MCLTLTCKCTCGPAMFLLMPSYADVSVVLQHHPPYIILAKFAHHARASHLTKNRARGPMHLAQVVQHGRGAYASC